MPANARWSVTMTEGEHLNPHLPEIALDAKASPRACVDIGGTKIAVSFLTHEGLSGSMVEATTKVGGQDALGLQVLSLLERAAAIQGLRMADLDRVGITAPGPFVRTPSGIELATPNICGGIAGRERGLPNDWRTAILEAPLRRWPWAITIVNDSAGALAAERRWGSLQDAQGPLQNCAYVTWSTGIGMGLCVDGKILSGKSGNAGHGGHNVVSDDTDGLCGCGTRGDVESLIAGNAIPRRFGHLGHQSSASLFDAVRRGDETAAAIVDRLCDLMARLIFNITLLGDLSKIAIGGSVFFNNQDILLPMLRARAFNRFGAITDGVEIVPAGLGDKVGDYAALSLVI